MITFITNGGRLGETISFLYGIFRFAKINNVDFNDICLNINYKNRCLIKGEKEHYVFRENFDMFKNISYIFKKSLDIEDFSVVDLEGKYDIAQMYNFYNFTNYNRIDNIAFKNYWSLTEYFVQRDFDYELLNMICRPKEIVKKLKNKFKKILNSSIAIHIRRGDFLGTKNKDMLLPEIQDNFDNYFHGKSYYTDYDVYKTIKKIDRQKYKNILVFTDDKPWCIENLMVFKDLYIVNNKNAYEDMILMSLCNNVIRNTGSFFSLIPKLLCEKK